MTLVLVLESWGKGSSALSIGSTLMAEKRMSQRMIFPSFIWDC